MGHHFIIQIVARGCTQLTNLQMYSGVNITAVVIIHGMLQGALRCFSRVRKKGINEILFMDLRQMGHPYEKKYLEFTEEDRAVIVDRFKSWRLAGYQTAYENIPEFCSQKI